MPPAAQRAGWLGRRGQTLHGFNHCSGARPGVRRLGATGSIARFGFAYGTLPGHVESGEERFQIEWHRSDDSVWYDILAFSRPNHPLARLPRERMSTIALSSTITDASLGPPTRKEIVSSCGNRARNEPRALFNVANQPLNEHAILHFHRWLTDKPKVLLFAACWSSPCLRSVQ